MLVSVPAAGRCNSSNFQSQFPDGLKGDSRVDYTGRLYSSQFPIQLPDGLSPFAGPDIRIDPFVDARAHVQSDSQSDTVV